MIIYLSLLVSLAGVLVYGFSTNPKLQEVGRLAFACGLLAFLFGVSSGHITLVH